MLVNAAVLTVATGFDLAHHEWGWLAFDAALIPLNLRGANYFWRRARGEF